MNVLLISTYELGHQSFSIAHVAALLHQRGYSVSCADLSIDAFDAALFESADCVAFSVPMHTAARLTSRLIPEVRKVCPSAHLAAFGLYATMNKAYFTELGVTTVLGGEFETGLVSALQDLFQPVSPENPSIFHPDDQKQVFVVPERGGLPALNRYAYLQLADGGKSIVGYTETSRGCKHHCTHCPVVPVYQGRFRAVPRAVVMADIRQQVKFGAEHITFGDPDFFNGPGHGLRIIEAMNAEFPGLTYDVTIKVEHLVEHARLLPHLRKSGCELVTTAVESVDDGILERLEKGHSRDDFFILVDLCRQCDLNLSPTFVPFTPWTTVSGYLDLLRTIVDLDIIVSVAPVQLSIRLLIPPGSLLLRSADMMSRVGPLDQGNFVYPWKHDDPGVDALQKSVALLVENAGCKSRQQLFSEIWELAHGAAGIATPHLPEPEQPCVRAYLSEPWYCCAEPTENQLDLV